MMTSGRGRLISRRRLLWLLGALFLTLALIAGCGADGATPEATPASGDVPGLEISSAAFDGGGTIPEAYTCDGGDVSPPLKWDAPPEGTHSFVLIVDDPDAPAGTWVHWVLYDLPADRRQLPEGLLPGETISGGGIQGQNDFRELGYRGPCPPRSSVHRYFFKLYALDTELDLEPGVTKRQVLDEMSGHVLAQGELVGRYGR